MATRVPVKSILKTQSSQIRDDPAKTQADKDRANLQLALKHANRIQRQKDVQALILSHIETLIDFPHVENTPLRAQAETFTRVAANFQPSDLDDLIEERRIERRCGYVLCDQVPRASRLPQNARWKVGGQASSFCSERCVRQMAYVKTQLCEAPAWERLPEQMPVIRLLHDDNTTLRVDDAAQHDVNTAQHDGRGARQEELIRAGGSQETSATAALHTQKMKMPLKHPDHNQNRQQDLAFERGETVASFKPKQVMTDMIVEKPHVQYRPISSINNVLVSHTAVEGYEPKVRKQGGTGSIDRVEDDSEQDD